MEPLWKLDKLLPDMQAAAWQGPSIPGGACPMTCALCPVPCALSPAAAAVQAKRESALDALLMPDKKCAAVTGVCSGL